MCHLFSSEIALYDAAGLGSTSSGLPIKKCPGVSTSMPLSSAEGSTVRGLLLRQDTNLQSGVPSQEYKSMLFHD